MSTLGTSNLVIFILPSPITQFTSGTARHCLYTYIDRVFDIDTPIGKK